MKTIQKFVGLAIVASCWMGSSAMGDAVVNGQIDWVGGTPVGDPANGSTISTIERIYFRVNTGGVIEIDTLSWETDGSWVDVNGDGEDVFFDPYIYLFNDDGSLDAGDLIDANDDSDDTFGDGSITVLDSYLSLNLAAGDYVLTIGSYFHDVNEAITGINEGFGPVDSNLLVTDHGDYRATFTGDVSIVPEPSSLMALLGVGGLAILRRRR